MVEGGMLVGLGTGSTTRHAIEMLGERFRGGLRFTGVPTSLGSAALARSFGIPLIESPTEAPIAYVFKNCRRVTKIRCYLNLAR